MRKEYDFSDAKPNPYAKRLKRSVTIRLDEATIAYFQGLAGELDVRGAGCLAGRLLWSMSAG